MSRNAGSVLVNSFSKGLITEATGLNFPEDAVTESDNVRFDKIGNAIRRLGFDLEGSAEALTDVVSNGVFNEFIWQAVALTGLYTFLVLQVGEAVYFYELDDADGLSSGVKPAALDLSDYAAPGATRIGYTPAFFTSGSGYLFITHPNCDPVLVRLNSSTNKFEAAKITVFIRDFEGVDDGLAVDEELTVDILPQDHKYNLKNQGWHSPVWTGSEIDEPDEVEEEEPQDTSLEFEEIS